MKKEEIRTLTEKYLENNGCHMIESGPDFVTTKLSIEADKDILNRPFYWMYVDKMSLNPEPATVSFVFDPETIPDDFKGEYLFEGSPRFTNIIKACQSRGKHTKLYQIGGGTKRYSYTSTPYQEWLVINYKVSYVCEQKKDKIVSLGINRHTGEIKQDFYNTLQGIEWSDKLPELHHIVPARVPHSEAVGEIEYQLQETLESENHTWASKAYEDTLIEIKQLDDFYGSESQLEEDIIEEKKKRLNEIVWQHHPRIEVNIINAGIFYLSDKV